MKRLGLSMQKIKAVFISHEHSDHIRGLHSLVKKFHLPVYITTNTLRDGRIYVNKQLVKTFTANEIINIGELIITAFPKFHDAADPYSFMVACKEIKVGIFTDIGLPCKNLVYYFQQCNAAFLEANYDEEMLEKGNYPYHLKKRIRGGKGHLSNKQALELFTTHKPSFMSHLFLSHLSKNNNCPRLVEELFKRHAGETKIIVASRFEETAVYHICKYENAQVLYDNNSVSQLQFSFS